MYWPLERAEYTSKPVWRKIPPTYYPTNHKTIHMYFSHTSCLMNPGWFYELIYNSLEEIYPNQFEGKRCPT